MGSSSKSRVRGRKARNSKHSQVAVISDTAYMLSDLSAIIHAITVNSTTDSMAAMDVARRNGREAHAIEKYISTHPASEARIAAAQVSQH